MLIKFVLPLFAAGILSGQTITTFAGNGTAGFSGDGGQATQAQINRVVGLAADAEGNIYLAEENNNRVRKVDTNGVISTFAGTGVAGYSGDGGPASQAQLNGPLGVCVAPSGDIYVNDQGNKRVRKISPSGTITTVAGNGSNVHGGDGGPATAAGMVIPIRCAVDQSGNLFIVDQGAHRVRKVDTNGMITTYAGNGSQGFSGDGGAATQAAMNNPTTAALDASGNLYISDQFNHRIRRIDTSGTIQTVAGNGTAAYSGDGGPATSASLNYPGGIVVDPDGTLFIVDSANQRIRKVSGGTMTTVAGTGTAGYSGDGGPASQAQVNQPFPITVDKTGNLYVGDVNNNRVRKISGAAAGAGPGSPTITLVANAEGDGPAIAPNTWVEIKGSSLAPPTSSRIWLDADFVNNQMPTQLDGVSVTMNGVSAYVYFISPAQLNVLSPPNLVPGPVEVKVTTGGVTSAGFTVQAQTESPSFFVFNGGPYPAATHADGTFLGPHGLFPAFPDLTTPAKPGETVAIYANGFGVTTVPVIPGAVTQSGSLPTPPIVRIGGIQATVQYYSLVAVGEYLLNVTVPASLADGDQPLTATYDGFITQAGTLITIQH